MENDTILTSINVGFLLFMLRFFLLLTIVVSITSCTSVKRKLGMIKSAPEGVIQNAENRSLVTPPNFDLVEPQYKHPKSNKSSK